MTRSAEVVVGRFWTCLEGRVSMILLVRWVLGLRAHKEARQFQGSWPDKLKLSLTKIRKTPSSWFKEKDQEFDLYL